MRCKFRLDSITRTRGTVTKLAPDGTIVIDSKGHPVTEIGELWSIELHPVYSNNDPKHENSTFWAYSPSGKFTLTTINRKAVDELELGSEVYIDITPAPQG